MIIGHGDIASVLPQTSRFLFFASGVSNSQEDRESEYHREMELLLNQPRNRRIVYFSSLAVFYSDTRYTQHKLAMEAAIKNFFPAYNIVRLGNIDWGTNPHTLINYLRDNPQTEIRDEYRYVIDKEEFLHWINLIPKWNCEMNLTGHRMKVKEIRQEFA